MNILYLTNHLNTGGITSYVLTLAAGMRKKGHQVYLASSGGELLGRFLELGVIYLPVSLRTKSEINPKIIFGLFKLIRLVRKYKIDIIHANSRTTQVIGFLLGQRTGVTYISTCHGFFKKRFFRRLFPCWGERVIAISQQVKEHLISDFGVEGERIVLIHSGIDVNKFSSQFAVHGSQIKEKLGLVGRPIVGAIGRLSDVKGHRYLIEAMPEVLKAFPETQFLIAGDGKTKGELLNLAKGLGLEKKVVFLPSLADTRDVLSAMDVFVMPSLKEGLGLSLMEAMAMGLAVVASSVGGITTLIKDGQNGLLVRPADAAGLAGAIITLLEDEDKRKSLGENASVFIRENFSEEKMAFETESLYEECLKPKD